MSVTYLFSLYVCIFLATFARVKSQDCFIGQLDVLFIWDSSSNVGINAFNNTLGFATNLAENFPIGPNGVQFGGLTYASYPQNLFYLNTYAEYKYLQTAIINTKYLSGNTTTDVALETATQFFDPSKGGRAGAPDVVILFTNGNSDNSVRTQEQAALLKSSGVFVVVVGLSTANNQELQGIASGSDAVFDINNFSGVLRLLQNYSQVACSQQVSCIKGQADILFLIDSSTNVGTSDFSLELRIATNLAENFQIGPDTVQFGAITFADLPNTLFDFNTYTEYRPIENALLNAQYISGNTNTSLALEIGRTFFTANHGYRRSAFKVAVVFTSGRSSDPVLTQQQAAFLKSIGVYVIVVGLPNSNNQELQNIASSSQVVFQIGDFDSILHALRDVIDNACNSGN